jgi:hypothetical protein
MTRDEILKTIFDKCIQFAEKKGIPFGMFLDGFSFESKKSFFKKRFICKFEGKTFFVLQIKGKRLAYITNF